MEKESPDFDVENGMESSRGGPLTTFIMMLPLIVVPTIAMLRPASQQGSLLSDLLSAAGGGGEQSGSTDSDPRTAPDPFDEMFEEEPDFSLNGETGAAAADLDEALFAEVAGDRFSGDLTTGPGPPTRPQVIQPSAGNAPGLSDDLQTRHLLEKLKQLGATRTMWFAPDGESAGFVAFFRAGRGIVTYRFEAVAASRAAAAEDVLRQALEWKGHQEP